MSDWIVANETELWFRLYIRSNEAGQRLTTNTNLCSSNYEWPLPLDRQTDTDTFAETMTTTTSTSTTMMIWLKISRSNSSKLLSEQFDCCIETARRRHNITMKSILVFGRSPRNDSSGLCSAPRVLRNFGSDGMGWDGSMYLNTQHMTKLGSRVGHRIVAVAGWLLWFVRH